MHTFNSSPEVSLRRSTLCDTEISLIKRMEGKADTLSQKHLTGTFGGNPDQFLCCFLTVVYQCASNFVITETLGSSSVWY